VTLRNNLWQWKTDRTGSGSCRIIDFDIRITDLLGLLSECLVIDLLNPIVFPLSEIEGSSHTTKTNKKWHHMYCPYLLILNNDKMKHLIISPKPMSAIELDTMSPRFIFIFFLLCFAVIQATMIEKVIFWNRLHAQPMKTYFISIF
jgi:hypothetical protein